MKFFEEHFTRQHFRRNPHKWLTALVLSPIHHAEMRYKSHYHLKFSHAKKLFFFDVLLLLSTLLLIASTLFWWMYDPTVTALVHVDVIANVETGRLQSGDEVSLTISVHNQSDVALTSPRLSMNLPPGFVIEEVSLPYEQQTNGAIHIELAGISSQEEVQLLVAGQYYGLVDDHASLQTMLIYTQDGRTTPESDVHRLFLTAREPSIETTFQTPPYIVLGQHTPIMLTLTNTQDHILPPHTLALSGEQIVWIAGDPTLGAFSLEDSTWTIPKLEEGTSAVLKGTLRVSAGAYDQTVPLSLQSGLTINGRTVPESVENISLSIARPQVQITNSWSDPYVLYGDKSLLALTVKNTGNVPLENPRISYAGTSIAVGSTSIAPGQSVPVSILMTATQSAIEQSESGPLFVPTLLFSGEINDISEYTYTTDITPSPLPVGTTVSLGQSARYYTAEGDQLGRGPLPPRVGEETKYWVFSQITNTVGILEDISFSTTLMPGVVWTGKSSVSRGANISYNASTRTATWQARSMNPYEAVGIYFEVAVTPTSNAIGSAPSLITKSTIAATDSHTRKPLFVSSPLLKATLLGDALGLQKGTLVQ